MVGRSRPSWRSLQSVIELATVYEQFPDRAASLLHVERSFWTTNLPRCPYCSSRRSSVLPREQRHHCNTCNTSFSVVTGTLLHGTKVDLQKWFLAIHIVLFVNPDVSARRLAGFIGVNRNTAWHMLKRIHNARSTAPLALFQLASFAPATSEVSPS